jgi:hypothetical protein
VPIEFNVFATFSVSRTDGRKLTNSARGIGVLFELTNSHLF